MRAAGWGRAALVVLAGAALIHLARLLALAGTPAVRRHHLETAWYIVAAVVVGLVLIRPRPAAEPAETGPAPSIPADRARRAPPASRLDTVPLPWVVLAALVASLALYAATLKIGLLSDDHVLVGMPILPGSHWEHVRPLPLLIWRGAVGLAGPAGLHLLNVLLHGINTVLVGLLAMRLVPDASRTVGVLAAALFLTSPVAVEPIAWSAGVFDAGLVTCALGYVLTLTSRRRLPVVVAGALAWLIAALATKETAVGLPVLGLLVAVRHRVSWPALALSWPVVIGYAVLRLQGGTMPLGEGSLRYLAKEIVSRVFGVLGQPFAAGDVAAVSVLLGLLLPLGYAVLAVGYAAGRGAHWRGLTMGAWVLAGAAPVLGFFYITPELSGSRYAYLPLVGWCIGLAELAWRQDSALARRTAVGFLIVVMVAGVVGGQRRIGAWREAATLRDRVLEEARRTLAASACPRLALQRAPEERDGAFVFRNGLPDALGAVDRVVTRVDAAVPGDCAFVWNGDRFVAAAVATAGATR